MEQIDILLATYNGEKYLKQQIDSILNQTHTNFRLLISDDCSEDTTKEILKQYEQKDNRIKIFYQEQNIGSTENFEFLLTQVESKYFALSDQDDIWLPDKIERALEKLERTKADLYFSDLILIDENGEVIENSFWKKKGFYKKIKKDKNYNGLLLNNYVTGCTIVSKKDFIKDILPIPKNSKYMLHDYWISIILSQKGKIVYDETPYIKYRQHSGNQVGTETKSNSLSTLKEIRDMFIDVKTEHFYIFVKNEEIFDSNKKEENKKALEYFEHLKNVKCFNFKNWALFWRLYKYENIGYYLANFVILNMPCIANIGFKLKRKGKKS